MLYRYKFENGLEIKIWTDEFPIHRCSIVKKIEKDFQSKSEQLYCSKNIALELGIPRDISNYGMLGVKYYNNSSMAKIIINVSEYDEELYDDNISIISDIVHKGIPVYSVNGIIKSINDINENSLLKQGIYEFDIGAHGEVGSSEMIFFVITNILIKLLYLEDFNEYSVKQAVDSGLASYSNRR